MPKPKALTREEWIKAGIIAAKELQRRETEGKSKPKKAKEGDKKDNKAKPEKKELKKASGLKGAKQNAEEKMSY